MINIKIICVGKLKENYLKEAQIEYLKRLTKYCKLQIFELDDEKFSSGNLSNNEIESIRKKECDNILQKLEKLEKCVLISLDLKGTEYDSIEFSNFIEKCTTYSSSTLMFIIGGSLGLNDEVLSKCDYSICFSKFTFPHQLIRIFLLEQIFRSFKILNNETYHH